MIHDEPNLIFRFHEFHSNFQLELHLAQLRYVKLQQVTRHLDISEIDASELGHLRAKPKCNIVNF